MKSGRRRNAPAIFMDDGLPNVARVFGVPLTLQPKQWDLLRFLASRPGRFCSYEAIYRRLWPGTPVGNDRIYYQKSQLVKALTRIRPQAAEWIQTLNKRGFVLNLKPSQIVIRLDEWGENG